MKKMLLLALSAGFLALSCGAQYYSVLIKNDSNKTVKYTYNEKDGSLLQGESKTYEVKAYTQPPEKVMDENGIASIQINRQGDEFTFKEADYLSLNVANKLPVEIKIKAGNYIDYNGSTELTVSANAENKTAKIYTKSPKFTYSSTSPVIIEWNYKDDAIDVILR